ncbi:hypothetical protein L1987_01661 [Smallanthus sonchifolius]|uniref:Uncharacterized protein n=1 Tax=Smallanthus sonchifolius TaxID=185202 RepID=A0ACB9K5N3_9ASTR|nr:hypothetical protein L1987_01661 [Smallanthus sonchifolius]
MSMPYTGLLIAQRFGVIVQLLSIAGSQTFFSYGLVLTLTLTVKSYRSFMSTMLISSTSNQNATKPLHTNTYGGYSLIEIPGWKIFIFTRKGISYSDIEVDVDMAEVDVDDLADFPYLEFSLATDAAIIGDDTPWDRLFELSFLETYKEVVVEFLLTFTYTVTAEEEADADTDEHELPAEPDKISFRMFGHAYSLTLHQWAVTTSLYYERETVNPLYTEAFTKVDREDLLVFWGIIGNGPWLRTKGRVSAIRDPLYRYLHRFIMTYIAPRRKSREWCIERDLFFLIFLLTGRQCSLATCLALYFASTFHRQKLGLLNGGAFITSVMCVLAPRQDHVYAMAEPIPPVRLDRRMANGMR